MATGSAEGRPLPELHLVTDRALVETPGFVERAAELLEVGGAALALHLRAGDLAARRVHELASRLAAVAAAQGAMLVVNDRLDVALAVGAGGVQLGRSSFTPGEVRPLLRAGMRVGASVHSLAEAETAVASGADFLIAGTLYDTPSHPGRPGSGTAWLREAAALGRPVVGIGGVTPGRVAELRAAGAHGAAVQRGVWDTARPAAALRAYLLALDGMRK